VIRTNALTFDRVVGTHSGALLSVAQRTVQLPPRAKRAAVGCNRKLCGDCRDSTTVDSSPAAVEMNFTLYLQRYFSANIVRVLR
jgi:hypothetical protein